jgi:methyl-accepting chemotaxis protein
MAQRMGMKAKLIMMSMGISLVSVVVGVIGLINIYQMNGRIERLYGENLVRTKLASEVSDALFNVRILVYGYLLSDTDAARADYKAKLDAGASKYLELVDRYAAMNVSEKERSLCATLKTAFTTYSDQYWAALLLESKGASLADILAEFRAGAIKTYDTYLGPSIAALLDFNDQGAKATDESNAKASAMAQVVMISVILAGLAFSLILALLISRGIADPISAIVRTLSDSSSQIALSSGQLSDSSQEIANGATEQAASIEETTSSMEELASMVRQNLENTKQASILSEKATEASHDGSMRMERMMAAMDSISRSAESIRNVIDVIDDIAFQTNMLALNAAVEAARAGEAGMGFAVVADEVKNLANRSSESAKETAGMIKEAIRNVEDGLAISKELAEIFKEILSNSKRVAEVSKEVESASIQQDQGIAQVNKAVMQFETVVQTNAGSAEETAGAAEELQSQVATLDDVVRELYLVVTGREYTEEHGRARRSRAVKGDRQAAAPEQHKAAPGKPAALTSPGHAEGNGAVRKISFEDDEEFSEDK